MSEKPHNTVDKVFSAKCMDLAFNSGEYDPLTDNNETTYINQYGKVVSDKSPYGNLE